MSRYTTVYNKYMDIKNTETRARYYFIRNNKIHNWKISSKYSTACTYLSRHFWTL